VKYVRNARIIVPRNQSVLEKAEGGAVLPNRTILALRSGMSILKLATVFGLRMGVIVQIA
jgi:hypothetical protein